MKKIIILTIVLLNIALFVNAQQVKINNENNTDNPCVSLQLYDMIEQQCAANIKKLGLDKIQEKSILTTTLDWPLKPASSYKDCGYCYISAHVDQEATAGSYKDYNCGTRSYDGHKGTDIATYPYPFYKMDNSQVEVIAAAAGTIVNKVDGNADKNCNAPGSTSNYIVVQHTDGSMALYLHMKKNSLTTKKLGDKVIAGEYLGQVGSSGDSSGPHLHFEVWSGSTKDTYKDPFSGTCNNINATTWWKSQKPYLEPTLNSVTVNSTDVVIPACSITETPNEMYSFPLNYQGPGLSPGYAKFYVVVSNDKAGMTAECKILNPDGSVFLNWLSNSSATDLKVKTHSFSKKIPTNVGTYTFQVTYSGQTFSRTFDIGKTSGIVNYESNQLNINPNPATDQLKFSKVHKVESVKIFNVVGRLETLKQVKDDNISTGSMTVDISQLTKGIYIIELKTELGVVRSKFIKE